MPLVDRFGGSDLLCRARVSTETTSVSARPDVQHLSESSLERISRTKTGPCGISIYFLGFSQHVLAFWAGVSLLIWMLAASVVLWWRSDDDVTPHA